MEFDEGAATFKLYKTLSDKKPLGFTATSSDPAANAPAEEQKKAGGARLTKAEKKKLREQQKAAKKGGGRQ
jgi:hypothetical protein